MSSISIVAKQFALQTRLLNNVLEDIEEAQGNTRLSNQVNHLRWIAGHLANTRFNAAPMLGLQQSYPYKHLFTDASLPPPSTKPIDETTSYPALKETLGYWNSFSGPFVNAVANIADEQAMHELPFGTPIGDKTLLGYFGFLTSHESYHIGQMSIIRKYLGLSAMSYK